MATSPCPLCGGDAPKYDGTDWCQGCVTSTLAEQAADADNLRQDRQVFAGTPKLGGGEVIRLGSK